jgi:D-3-phosphoglycerate dehydrogenase / 2-oxoglutarate reductase
MIKVLIADKMSDSTVLAMKELGAAVTVNPQVSEAELPGVLGDTEVLIVRSKKVNAAAIQSAPLLSLIIRAGAGVNTIDLPAASNRGIHVANCPGKNTDAVAELAIGLMIAADRRIVAATDDLRAGKWNKKEYGKAAGLKGRTLGVVGLGDIGRAVARRARGLEMPVVAWSRSLTRETAEELGIGFCASPEVLARQSDVVSVHLALKPDTRHLIGKDFLDAMKAGAILVNTSRGEVVDTAALKDAIRAKKLRVGLDVFEDEPAGGEAGFPDKELAELVTCTPHIGASTDQASEAIAAEVVRIVKSYQETGKPLHAVNLRAKTSAKINLVVRHYNHVGVLAGVLDELRNEGVNIEEMENTIFESGTTATCTLRLDDVPSDATMARIGASKDIIRVMLK